jgi:DNA polymerase-3 subunit gamma/tau
VKTQEQARTVEAVVREESPAPAVTPPAPKEAVPEARSAVSTEDFWPQLVSLVQERRPLAVSWLQAASLLGIAGKVIKVGFPTTEGFARDSLLRPAQLSFLEGLAQELLGQVMKFEMVLDASLKAPQFSEIGLGLLDEAPPAAKPKPEPKSEAKSAPKEETPKPAAAMEPEAAKVTDDFYNDPLIQSAMVKFKARLLPAG